MKQTILLVTLSLMCATMASGQTTAQERMKRRSELMEQNRKLQEMKVSDESREMAKEMKDDGWKIMPGQLPLAQQIERSTLFQNQFEDDLLTPAYVHGEATSGSDTYDGALFQAMELSRQNLIGSIESKITQIVDQKLGNKQSNAGIAQSVVATMSRAKSFMSQHLGQTTPVITAYRILPSGEYQVRVMIFYSMAEARRMAVNAAKQNSKEDAEQLEKLIYEE